MINISVITPVYNGASFVGKSICSVLNQTGITFEHIIVNDGSTDNTVDVIESKMHNDLVFINSIENKGQASARNSALSIAKGEFVCFLDADDEFCNEVVLSRWYIEAYSHSADLCKAQNEIQRNDTIALSYSFKEYQGKVFNGLNDFPEILNATSCWQFLYKRSFLLKFNLKFLDNLKQREDRPFFFHALLYAETIFCSSLVSTRYLVREDSTMRTLNLEQLQYFNVHLNHIVEVITYHLPTLSMKVIEFTIQYYVSTFMNYWRGLIVLNWNDDATNKYLSLMHSLVCLSPFNVEGPLLDIISSKRSSNSDLFLYYLIFKNNDKTSLLRLIKKGDLPVSSLLTLGNSCASYNERALFIEACSTRVSTLEDMCHSKLSEYKFIIHMGLPKTGSSFIQKFFEINRKSLYEDYGVYFPISGQEKGSGLRAHRTSGHAKLIENIINNRDDVSLELQSELGGLQVKPKYVLISSENIISHRYWNNGNSLHKIIDALGGQCFGILFLRNQLEWYNSMYQEMVMSPGVKYSESFKNFYSADWDHDYLYFDELRNKVVDSFSGRCSILNYDNCSDNLLNIFCRELEILNIESYEIPSSKCSNKASSALVAYITNKTNEQNRNISTEQYLNIQKKLIDIVKLLPSQEKMVFYDEQDVEFITSKYRISNFKLLTEFKINVELCESEGFLNAYNNNVSHYVNHNYRILKAVLDNTITNEKCVKVERQHREGNKLVAFVMQPFVLIKYLLHKRFRHKVSEAFNLSYHVDLDYDFYAKEYPESSDFNGGIFLHLVENRNNRPNNYFEPAKYIELNSDVKEAGIHPTMHYYMHGKKEGRIF